MNSKFIFRISIVVLLSSCIQEERTCPPVKEKTYKLSSDEKLFVPYAGTETLKFTNSKGDTLLFQGGGRATYMETKNEILDDYCGVGLKKHIEKDTVTFYKKLYIALDRKIRIKIITNEMVQIELSPYTSISQDSRMFEIYFNRLPDLDSMKVNSKTYYDVFYRSYSNVPEHICYTKKDGIIQFNDDSNTKWERLP